MTHALITLREELESGRAAALSLVAGEEPMPDDMRRGLLRSCWRQAGEIEAAIRTLEAAADRALKHDAKMAAVWPEWRRAA